MLFLLAVVIIVHYLEWNMRTYILSKWNSFELKGVQRIHCISRPTRTASLINIFKIFSKRFHLSWRWFLECFWWMSLCYKPVVYFIAFYNLLNRHDYTVLESEFRITGTFDSIRLIFIHFIPINGIHLKHNIPLIYSR